MRETYSTWLRQYREFIGQCDWKLKQNRIQGLKRRHWNLVSLSPSLSSIFPLCLRLILRQSLSLQWEDGCQQCHAYTFPSADRFIQLDTSGQSPQIDSCWGLWGPMPIVEMLWQEGSLKCSDWPKGRELSHFL